MRRSAVIPDARRVTRPSTVKKRLKILFCVLHLLVRSKGLWRYVPLERPPRPASNDPARQSSSPGEFCPWQRKCALNSTLYSTMMSPPPPLKRWMVCSIPELLVEHCEAVHHLGLPVLFEQWACCMVLFQRRALASPARTLGCVGP